MSRSIEHMLHAHELAQARRRAGRRVWDEIIDVSAFFHNDEPFLSNRDNIIAAVKRSKWWKRNAKPTLDNADFHDAILGLEQAIDADEFDQYWDELYNMADVDRVWINTIGRKP